MSESVALMGHNIRVHGSHQCHMSFVGFLINVKWSNVTLPIHKCDDFNNKSEIGLLRFDCVY